jgi:hypothetical protein
MLLITLSGWTQHSQNWDILSKKDVTCPICLTDTIIQYNFYKSDLRNLRLYIVDLEAFKETNVLNEQIIIKQGFQLTNYKKVVDNQKIIIASKDSIISETDKINVNLQEQVIKYRKKAGNWPYWLSGGFIGGIVLCLLIK